MELSEENQQLVEEQIARLEKERILETRADERFRLECKIKALKDDPTDFLNSLSLSPNVIINQTQYNHIYQYNPEIIEKVLKLTEEKLEITKIAFYTFLEIAGEQQVPIEQLPVVMGQMAERYKLALQGIKNLENNDDPEVKQLIQQAGQLLREQVDLDQAEQLLNQAHTKKKDKKSRLKEMLHKEEIEQAAISFQTGEVKLTQLKYKAAGEYYRRAAEELPKDNGILLAYYLNNG